MDRKVNFFVLRKLKDIISEPLNIREVLGSISAADDFPSFMPNHTRQMSIWYLLLRHWLTLSRWWSWDRMVTILYQSWNGLMRSFRWSFRPGHSVYSWCLFWPGGQSRIFRCLPIIYCYVWTEFLSRITEPGGFITQSTKNTTPESS